MTSESYACLPVICTLPRITVKRSDEEVKVIYENKVCGYVVFGGFVCLFVLVRKDWE